MYSCHHIKCKLLFKNYANKTWSVSIKEHVTVIFNFIMADILISDALTIRIQDRMFNIVNKLWTGEIKIYNLIIGRGNIYI
jgi:hypothetical protein